MSFAMEKIKPWHLCAFLVLITFCIYLPSVLTNDFVHLDDALLITRNPAVQQISFWSLKEIFTTFDPELYVPLTLFTYQIEHAMFGLNPVVFHLTNLILHVANAVLVFWILFVLSQKRRIAFLGAMLFALHPIQTEAVVWAAARKDVLSAFFFLGSFLTFLLHRRDHVQKFYRWSIALFFLGLLSKVSILMMPILLFLLDWKDRRPLTRASIQEKIPYLALSVVFGIVAIVGKTQNLASTDLLTTLLLMSKSILHYLWKLMFPLHLTAIYTQEAPVTLASEAFQASVAGVILLLFLTMLLARRSRTVAFGIGFFLLMLLPSGTNFLKNEFLFFASDRYIYLASMGLFFLIALAVDRLCASSKKIVAIGAQVCSVLIVTIFAGLSVAQARTWRDSIALYEQSLRFYPRFVLVWNNLGDYHMQTGNFAKAQEMFEHAVALDPTLIVIQTNLGNAYRENNRFDRAIATFEAVIHRIEAKEHPGPAELGAYYFLGELLDQMGKREESLRQFERAIAKGPDFAETYFNLGLQHQKHGDPVRAEEAFRKAIAVDAIYARAHYHLAAVLAEQGKIAEAILELEESLRIDPHQEKAREHLENLRSMR